MTEWMTVPQMDEGGCNRKTHSDGPQEKRDKPKNRGTGTWKQWSLESNLNTFVWMTKPVQSQPSWTYCVLMLLINRAMVSSLCQAKKPESNKRQQKAPLFKYLALALSVWPMPNAAHRLKIGHGHVCPGYYGPTLPLSLQSNRVLLSTAEHHIWPLCSLYPNLSPLPLSPFTFISLYIAHFLPLLSICTPRSTHSSVSWHWLCLSLLATV